MTRGRAVRYGGAVAAAFALVVLVVVFFPWNTLRGPLASFLEHRLHRPIAITGDLHVHPGWTTRVEIDGVTIGNAEWSDLQPMASAQRIALAFGLPSLLRLTPDRVQLSGAAVVLEKSASGEPNWHFGAGNGNGGLRLGSIVLDRGSLRYRDPALRADITADVATMPATQGARSALRFDGRGTLRGEAFTITGHGRGLAELRDVDAPYAIAFELRAGATRIGFDGTVVPASPQSLRGALHLRGADLSQLYPIVPSPLPWTPPYDLSGELTHVDDEWRFRRIAGTVGDSDLAGDFRVDVGRERPLTVADLSSRRFDYKDLGGFIGLPPGEPGKKAQTAEQRREAAKRAATYRVLPDKPFDLAKLRTHDVDLKFRGASVRWGRFPIDNLVTQMTLTAGVMRFEPLDFGIAGGHVVGHVVLDASQRTPRAQGEIEIRHVELKRIFPQLESPRGSAGRFGGRARFRTAGNSVADMFAAANGEGAIAMRGGQASTLTLVLTNLDLARAATLLIGGDQTAEIACAITAVHVEDGVMEPDLLVADTSAELIKGEGSVDFRSEKYDLRLHAHSKQPSILALRGPVVIGGTFGQPDVHPAVGPVVARIGAAVGLGALAPPLALLPLIDLGDAPDADCRRLYDDARIATGTGGRNATAPANAQQRSTKAKRSTSNARLAGAPEEAPAAERSPAARRDARGG
jgi:uncharacterized protein involved in outer membrane biogenesis